MRTDKAGYVNNGDTNKAAQQYEMQNFSVGKRQYANRNEKKQGEGRVFKIAG
jgi:hypothetical protein